MNNSLVKTLLSLKYDNKEINKHIAIFKRTKSERIKYKHFKELFSKAVKEKKVIKCDDFVAVDFDVYNSFQEQIHLLEKLKEGKATASL